MRSVFLLTLCISVSLLSAGISGNLIGTITDVDSKPLMQASIQITELGIGIQSDEQGRYRLRRIPAGSYDVVIGHIGYETKQITSVTIIADETRVLDVRLPRQSIKLPAVIVEEDVYKVVDRRRTSSNIVITESKLEKAVELQDIIALEAGIYANNGELHIRGGRINEIVYSIDGLSVTDAVFGGTALEVDTDAIRQMQIMTGGFPAEFGNAQSGIINVITKDGSDGFHGKCEWNSDHLLGGNHWNKDQLKLALGSPIFKDIAPGKLSIFTNIAANLNDSRFRREFNVNPMDEIPSLLPVWEGYPDFYQPYKSRDSFLGMDLGERMYNFYNANSKLTWRPDTKNLISLAARGNQNSWVPYDHQWRYALNEYNRISEDQRQYVATWRHYNSARTGFELKAAYYRKDHSEGPRTINQDAYFTRNDDTFDIHAANEPGNCTGIQYLTNDGVIDYVNGLYFDWAYMPAYTYVPRPISEQEFVHPGSIYPVYKDNSTEALTLKAHVDYQPTDVHTCKSGVEFTQHYIDTYSYTLPWVIEEQRYSLYLAHYCTPADTTINQNTGEVYYHYSLDDLYAATLAASGETYAYKATPWQLSWYLQDRMEWEGLIVHAGLRLDSWYLGRRYQRMNRYKQYEWVDIDRDDRLQMMLSPRLGVSHAISTSSVLHFAMNYQSQLPQMRYVFTDATAQDAYLSQQETDDIIVSNPALEPQVTIGGELGLQYQFTASLAADITAYYKKNYNYVSIEKVYDEDEPSIYWYQYATENYGSAWGVDINLQQALALHLIGSCTYSLSWAKGTDSRTLDYLTQDTQSLREFPLDWDVRHNLGVNLGLEVGQQEYLHLPVSDTRIPLDDYSINLLYNLASGTPFTDRSDPDYEINDARKPHTAEAHLSIIKRFRLNDRLTLKCYMTINNLFDKDNVYFAYLKTGSPSDDGVIIIDPELGYSLEETQQIHGLYTDNPANIAGGRRITLGVALSW